MAHNEQIITPHTIVKRVDRELLTSELGDELVMMDVERGNYVSLNKTGRIIWNYLEHPIVISDLINSLMVKYNVEREECVNDTLSYLRDMFEKYIIAIK